MSVTTPTQLCLQGARDTLPMLVGAMPFGVIFGTLAAASAMAPWQGQLMSLLVYAGSSQFIAIGLVAGHTSMLLIWLTTFFVNLRHMLYAASFIAAGCASAFALALAVRCLADR